MARTPKPAADPAALKRESAGRYATGDGRFSVDQASGGWMVTDAELANELGLPLVRGPFPTLAEARSAVAEARSASAPTSELAARMAALPTEPRAAERTKAPSRERAARREVAPAKAPPARSAPTPPVPPPPPPVDVREWQPGDGDALRALWAGIGMGSLGDDDASLAIMAGRNPGLLLVAVTEDRVVGSALGAWDGRRGWIYHVATAPDHRRRGLARRLVTTIEDGLRALGCPKVNVMVLDGADDAVAFWTAAGYTRLDARQYGRTLTGDAGRRPASARTAKGASR